MMPLASSDYGLFAEVVSEGKEYHYCNGELNIVLKKDGDMANQIMLTVNQSGYGFLQFNLVWRECINH